jgi:hypothetical protein
VVHLSRAHLRTASGRQTDKPRRPVRRQGVSWRSLLQTRHRF